MDSLGTRLAGNSDRKELVKASRETVKRYQGSDLRIKAGFGGDTLAGTGSGVTPGLPVAGIAAGPAVGGLGGFGVALVAGTGGLILGPALICGGIVRHNSNNKVGEEITRRHAILSATVTAKEGLNMDIFFPLAPSPTQLEITYTAAGVEKVLTVDTNKALSGLHLAHKE